MRVFHLIDDQFILDPRRSEAIRACVFADEHVFLALLAVAVAVVVAVVVVVAVAVVVVVMVVVVMVAVVEGAPRAHFPREQNEQTMYITHACCSESDIFFASCTHAVPCTIMVHGGGGSGGGVCSETMAASRAARWRARWRRFFSVCFKGGGGGGGLVFTFNLCRRFRSFFKSRRRASSLGVRGGAVTHHSLK